MKTIRIIHLVLLALLAPVLAVNPPGILNHQGRIAVNGANYDGPGHFKFALVNGGTNTLWSNDATSSGGGEPAAAVEVPIAKGHYAVLLGDTAVPNMTAAIPASVFTDHETVALRLWFATASDGPFELLTPDRRIAASGYALAAQQAAAVAPGGVTSIMLADGAVTAAKLANGAVTSIALAPGAVTSGAIADGSVTSSDLALGATGLVRKPVLLAEVGGGAQTPASIKLPLLHTDRTSNPGGLDETFGENGMVSTAVSEASENSARAVEVQPDGKIVIGGNTGHPTDRDFAILRYNVDGSLDSGFGSNGIARFDIGSTQDAVFGLALQNDGKILAAGHSIGDGYDFTMVRLNADGSPDTAFGSAGIVMTHFNPGINHNNEGRDIVVQPDGKIVFAGQGVTAGSKYAFGIARYLPDGTLDTTFSGDGWVVTGVGSGHSSGQCVALQADGKIVHAGLTDGAAGRDFAIIRYLADGGLDASFDSDGVVTTDLGGDDWILGVAVTADQKIIVGGYSTDDFALAQYMPDGSLDAGFGTGGIVVADLGGVDKGSAVAILEDGNILVCGTSDEDFALACFAPDGSLDASFGSGGFVKTDFGGMPDDCGNLALASDGRIVLAGSTDGGAQFAVARYMGSSFSWTGNAAGVFSSDGLGHVVSSSAGQGRYEILDLTDPSTPQQLSELISPHGSLSLAGVRDVWVSGTTAFLTDAANGALNMIDVSAPANPQAIAVVQDGVDGFDRLAGAWSVFVSGNIAYVTATGDDALTMIDVSNPSAPVKLAEIVDGAGGFTQLGGARGVHVVGTTAYVTAADDHALTIIDVSQPAAPVLLSEIVDESGGFTKLAGAREVFVLEGVAYVTAGEDDALTLIDVSNPSSPVLLCEVVDGVGGFNRLDGAAGVHVSGSIAMVTAEGDDAVSMIDVSNPAAPVLLEETVDESGGFTKLAGADGIFIAGTLALVASNLDDALTLMDLASPEAEFAGTVTNSILAPDAVTSDKIFDQTIVAADLADAAVIMEKLADGAVGGNKLAQGGVGSAALAQAAVTGEKLADGVVGGAKLAAGGVGSAALAQGAVTGDKLGTAAVAGIHLGSAVVTGDKLADGAVGGSKLAQGGVATAALAQGAVTGDKLGAAAVAGIHLGSAVVTGDKLADGAVGGSKLAAGGVATGALASGAVTNVKLASGSVTMDKLALGGSSGQILFNTGTATEWRNPVAVLGDESPVNEIQQLSIDGGVLALSKGGGSVSISDADADPTNELQTLSLNGNSLSLLPSGGSPVDLGQYFLSDGSQAFGGALDLNSNEIRSVRKLGIGVGTSQAALHVFTRDTESPPVTLLEHSISTISDQLVSAATLRTVNTNALVDGFGAGLAFENKSSTAGPFTIARIGAARDGADELGALVFQTQALPGGLTTRMTVRAGGDVEMQRDLYIGNADGSSDDTIYFDRNGDESLQWQNSQGRFMFSDDVWATTFNPTSDRNQKEKFEDVDPMEVLDQVAAMPVTTWKFKDDDPALRHIGPMAQDFHQAFGLGLDDRHISTTDADGVAFAAIQGLKRLLDDKERKIRDLEKRLEKLERSSRGNR